MNEPDEPLPPSLGGLMGKWGDANTAANIVMTVGVPSVIAMFLVWQVSGSLASDLQQRQVEHQNLTKSIESLHREQLQLVFYMRAICLNVAVDTTAERRCDASK